MAHNPSRRATLALASLSHNPIGSTEREVKLIRDPMNNAMMGISKQRKECAQTTQLFLPDTSSLYPDLKNIK